MRWRKRVNREQLSNEQCKKTIGQMRRACMEANG